MGYADVLANEYNPYTNREQSGQLGKYFTLITLIKGILGTGILAMPFAYKEAGWLTGTIVNVILHFLMCYSMHILFKSMYYMCKKNEVPYVTYAHTFKQALEMGPNCFRKCSYCAPSLINFFIILYQFGTLCVYLLFSASNLKMVVDDNTTIENHLSLWCYMTILLVPILLLTYINLNLISLFSNIANVFTIVSLGIVYYFVFKKIESLSERVLVGSPMNVALFIGISMFSLFSVGVMLSIEKNMKDGSQWLGWCGVLNQGILFVTVLGTFTGFVGYWKYGDEVKPSITLNLGKNPAAWSVQILLSFAMLVSYALQAYPISDIIMEIYIQKRTVDPCHLLFWDFCLRSMLVFSSFVLAVPIPFMELFISLFGSFCFPMLGMVIPFLIDICIRWENFEFGFGKIHLIIDILIIIFGFFVIIIGSYSAIKGILHHFSE